MTDYWHALLDHAPLLLLISALIFERTFAIPAHLHPFVAFRQVALQLARRVHPSLQRPPSQQRLSGCLALVLLLILWLGIPALLYALAELKQWFAAALLWLCLFSQPWLSRAHYIHAAVSRQQKQLARARLQPWLNRDCTDLSTLGIEKAASEHTAVRLIQGWWGVLFWFALAGPLAALAYRLVFELRYAWPAQYKKWHHFGATSNALFTLINWLPHVVVCYALRFVALLSRAHQPHNSSKRMAPLFASAQNNTLFASLTQALPLALGSPVKFQGVRYTQQRYQHPKAPSQGLIKHSVRHLGYLQLGLFCLMLPLFMFLWY